MAEGYAVACRVSFSLRVKNFHTADMFQCTTVVIVTVIVTMRTRWTLVHTMHVNPHSISYLWDWSAGRRSWPTKLKTGQFRSAADRSLMDPYSCLNMQDVKMRSFCTFALLWKWVRGLPASDTEKAKRKRTKTSVWHLLSAISGVFSQLSWKTLKLCYPTLKPPSNQE